MLVRTFLAATGPSRETDTLLNGINAALAVYAVTSVSCTELGATLLIGLGTTTARPAYVHYRCTRFLGRFGLFLHR